MTTPNPRPEASLNTVLLERKSQQRDPNSRPRGRISLEGRKVQEVEATCVLEWLQNSVQTPECLSNPEVADPHALLKTEVKP